MKLSEQTKKTIKSFNALTAKVADWGIPGCNRIVIVLHNARGQEKFLEEKKSFCDALRFAEHINNYILRYCL